MGYLQPCAGSRRRGRGRGWGPSPWVSGPKRRLAGRERAAGGHQGGQERRGLDEGRDAPGPPTPNPSCERRAFRASYRRHPSLPPSLPPSLDSSLPLQQQLLACASCRRVTRKRGEEFGGKECNIVGWGENWPWGELWRLAARDSLLPLCRRGNRISSAARARARCKSPLLVELA
jgi:hypothetical protein